jgi:putative hydroxymethylpyrimidine transport system substrate-binding protein
MFHLTGSRPLVRPAQFGSFLVVLLVLTLLACGGGSGAATQTDAATKPPTKVVFMAGFKPQANLPFVGAYVAKEKGFFQEQGLDVDIRHSLSGESMQLLQAGTVNFTTADASDVIKRIADPGLDLLAVALIGQKGQQGFAVGAKSGISTPKDWAGKTLGYKGSVPPEFSAIARSAGLDPSKVNQVRVGFDPRVLSEGQVDILAVFMSNEPDTLAQAGYPTKVFDPNDYGVPLLGLTYVTTHAYAAKQPETVAKFVKACLHGIDYAASHREEALDIVMKYAPDEQRQHQGFILDTELARAESDVTKANGLGWQTAAQWQALEQVLVDYQAIARPVDVNRAFTAHYLKQIYKDGKLVWP